MIEATEREWLEGLRYDDKFPDVPVPWAVRLSSEGPRTLTRVATAIVAEPVQWAGELAIADADAFKDHRNVWWVPEHEAAGGEPQFSQLSAERQRVSFDEKRCQVCAKRMEKLTFIVEARNSATPVITSHAPVCTDCIPLTLKFCPHWKRTPNVLLQADGFTVTGVYGDVLRVENNEVFFDETDTVRFDDPRILRTFAKQLIVRLDGCQVIDLA